MTLTAARALALEAAAASFLSRFPSATTGIFKGLMLAKELGTVVAVGEGVFRVRGSKGFHTTRRGSCTCEARVRCYHRWALCILVAAGELPEPPREQEAFLSWASAV
jgi:hypothetical protein